MCKKDFPENDLLKQESSGMLFCREDFGNATIIIGMMQFSKDHPEYKHPALPRHLSRNATFDEVLAIYQHLLN